MSEQNYPAVELVYPLALKSYEITSKQLDDMDTRIQTLLAFATTVSLALPVAIAGKGIKFGSVWFILAAVAYITAVCVGVRARLVGSILMPGPTKFYEKWLHLTDWQFKKNFIFFAGKHFEDNCRLIKRKGRLAGLMSILFLLEAVLLALWLVRLGS